MRKAIAVGVICLAASLAVTATVIFAQTQSRKPASVQLTPLNEKTGLWQTTETLKYTGLPPQIAAAVNPIPTFKSCLKPKDLSPSKWTTKEFGLKCSSLTVLKSTGTDLEAQGRGCDAGNGMTADGDGNFHVLDSEHVTGRIVVTFSGSTPFGNGPVHAHVHYTSKWIGATCPAGMN